MKARIFAIIFSAISIVGLISYPPAVSNGNPKMEVTLTQEIKSNPVFQQSHELDLKIDSLQKKIKEQSK